MESLTSYIDRLAEAHCVPTGLLCRRELEPLVKKLGSGPSPAGTGPRGEKCAMIYYAKVLNGTNESSSQWAQALESLTGCPEIRYLTLRPWKSVLALQSLLRPFRAWCPRCYAEWRQNKEAVYEPLLWAIRVVEVCAHHQCRLEQFCPHCQQRLPLLASKSRTGHCPRCQRGLSADERVAGTDRRAAGPEDLGYAVWVANNLGEVLAAAPHLPTLPSRHELQQTITDGINRIAQGSIAAFSRFIQIDSRLVRCWSIGQTRPLIDHLLKIGWRLKASLLELLTGQAFVGKSDYANAATSRKEEVRHVLRAALDEDPPPSLSEVAQRLGYQRPSAFRGFCPDLYEQVKANYEQSPRGCQDRKHSTKRRHDDHTLRQTLEQELKQDNPASITSISRRLGYQCTLPLYHRFPDLCHAITVQRGVYRKNTRNARIKQALDAALEECPPRTLRQIHVRLGYEKSDLLWEAFPELCQAIRARHTEFRRNRLDEIQSRLREVLSENPPPTVQAVANRLGYSDTWLYKHCAELCHAIALRYTNYRKECIHMKMEWLRKEIRQIVKQLHNLGLFPSQGRVRALVSDLPIKSYAVFNHLLTEAREELGITETHS